MKWFLNRFAEATGKAGLTAVISGIFNLAQGGDVGSSVALILTGAASFVAKEKGSQ